MGAETYKKRTVEDTLICIPCGNVFIEDDDFDCLGSESGICCPDCGNENFVSVKGIIDNHDALVEACKAVIHDILDKPTSYVRLETLKKIQSALKKIEEEK